jgi:hypothetical protein
MINNYILIILILLTIIYLLNYLSFNVECFEEKDNENLSWSKTWNKHDFKARVGANCNPIKKEKRQFRNLDVFVWTVPSSCENGLPHTRYKDVIAMPQGHSSNRYEKTIQHELVHISQRNFPKEWEDFYNEEWDYELFNEPPKQLPNEIIEKLRANPDTNNKPWTRWNKRWWTIPVYSNLENPTLMGASILWFDEETRNIINDPPKDWVSFFGQGISQDEHPNEISAVLLVDDNNSEASIKVKEFYENLNNLTTDLK